MFVVVGGGRRAARLLRLEVVENGHNVHPDPRLPLFNINHRPTRKQHGIADHPDEKSTEEELGDFDAAAIAALGNTLESIEIVEPAPGSGFRMILHMRSKHGTPVVETLSRRFTSLREADEFAATRFGAINIDIKLDTHSSTSRPAWD